MTGTQSGLRAARRCSCLFLLAGCRGPDYVEVSPWAEKGDISRTRVSYEDDSLGLMLTAGWNLGQTGRAMRNLSELDVSKAGALRTEPTAGAAPVPVIVAPPEGAGDAAGIEHVDNILYGVGALLAALGALVWKLRPGHTEGGGE